MKTPFVFVVTAALRSEVKQLVYKCSVESCRHLAIHNQGGRGSNAQLEQFVPGFFVDHDIFMDEFHFFAGQILCQCGTGASEGLRIQSDLPAAHNLMPRNFYNLLILYRFIGLSNLSRKWNNGVLEHWSAAGGLNSFKPARCNSRSDSEAHFTGPKSVERKLSRLLVWI